MTKGLLLIVSGPAGSGKGTVNSLLLEREDFVYSVSATTRSPRPGELNGVNYHFISREEFTDALASGDMLEYTEYCGNFYGTPKRRALEILESGKNLILEIEVDGARQVKEKFPDAVLIMLLPPSFSVQEARLRGRATETEEKIKARLARTREEVRDLSIYDYIVYNLDGKAAEAAEDILSIVRAEKLATLRNPDAEQKYFEN